MNLCHLRKGKAKARAGDQWGEGHDKKEDHLHKLRKKRKFEAQKSGQLLQEENLDVVLKYFNLLIFIVKFVHWMSVFNV